ncbi:LapA family protein [Saccharicrinis aurantiacus]|uniref:LapA family protein n=1 Tax=Saccharicrinis aurantiacus TaxID=1849719 RepID=UPI00094FECAC|nr:LapA family protein [Saccharicrinis aurantiacus]
MKKSFWVLIVLAVLIVMFSVQNASTVEFHFFTVTSEISLAVLLIITFISGVLIGAIYSSLARRNKKNKNESVKDISIAEDENIDSADGK